MPACTRPYCQRARPGRLGFAGFQDLQRRHDANPMEIEGRQQFDIFRHFAIAQHIVDDQVVALPGHGGDGVAHAAQGTRSRRSGPDHDRRLAALPDGLIGKAVGMVLQGIGQHLDEGVHLDMQERFGGYCLQRPGDRTFAGTADAIEQDDPGIHVRFSFKHRAGFSL
ncbi:hypothetical protein ASE05_21200 [Mesorhizobium sp. Root172]|uniref:Uncharacterized protein n=1 Tax=Rhizobium loti TaxID=381 RepID=A0AA91F4G9_RHILI|nr:hypothetical protein ASE05_21200 [Mesorhizobium sp. Root172]OBQ65864.1 hypothetical protein A8145_17185 [Mesorhizobium loti]